MVEIKEHLSISDYTGQEIGVIYVEVIPCDQNGNEYEEQDNAYVESPQELLGRSVSFVVKIINCRGLPNKFTVSLEIDSVLRFSNQSDRIRSRRSM